MTGLYIHIPFCLKKCNYCDFASFPSLISRADEYIDALCREIGQYKGENIDTVYFGGGTPSVLTESQLGKIFDSVTSSVNLAADSEITIEVNPCTSDLHKAGALYSMGFNRVSIGSQSMIDTELAVLSRLHSSDDIIRTYGDFSDSGFANISLDLMYALPGQTLHTLGTSMERMLKLSPGHISCYGLKIEPGTPFEAMALKGEITEKTDDEYADMYEYIGSYLSGNGYVQYELSNFSRPGCESKHNLKYWTLSDYIGIGLSASSFYKGARYTHSHDFEKYVQSFENSEFYRPSHAERMGEYMMLSLRLTQRGANKSEFEFMFGTTIEHVFHKPLHKHISLGLIEDTGSSYILTPKAYYISNSVLCDFI